MKLNSDELAKIIYNIPQSSSIGIFTHVGVDGDCLGSSLALKYAMDKLGCNVIVMADEPVPKSFGFMPGIDDITVYSSSKETDPGKSKTGKSVILNPDKSKILDFGILIDCSQSLRIGKYAEVYDNSLNKIVVDHHINSTCDVQYCYIDSASCATGQLIYNIIKKLEIISGKNLFSIEIAVFLMTAIISDTGGFRYSNTNMEAFGIAFDLFSRFPIDLAEINYQLLEKQSLTHICLRGKAYEAAQFHENNQIVICPITQAMLEGCKTTEDDVEGICSELKNIDGVAVAFVLKQRTSGEIRVNVRSSERFDSAGFAAFFSGGGHMRAAGFTLKDLSMEEAIEMIISKSRENLIKTEGI